MRTSRIWGQAQSRNRRRPRTQSCKTASGVGLSSSLSLIIGGGLGLYKPESLGGATFSGQSREMLRNWKGSGASIVRLLYHGAGLSGRSVVAEHLPQLA